MGYRKKRGDKRTGPSPTSLQGTCPLQGLLSGDTAGRGGEAMAMFQPQGGFLRPQDPGL
ncbi:hypothetical protein BREVNS_2091 [Brevinematales bacterium NS]|nr:hypothetical protein BREVNS_2091 [Brevinematales bacterium NS]